MIPVWWCIDCCLRCVMLADPPSPLHPNRPPAFHWLRRTHPSKLMISWRHGRRRAFVFIWWALFTHWFQKSRFILFDSLGRQKNPLFCQSLISRVAHSCLSLSLLSQCLVSLSLGGAKWCSCGGIRGRSSCSGIFIDLGSLHSWLLTSDKSNFELTASVEFIYSWRCGNLHHLVSWNTCIQHVSFSLLD